MNSWAMSITPSAKYDLRTDEEALKHITKNGKWSRSANRDAGKWIKTLRNLVAAARKTSAALMISLQDLREEALKPRQNRISFRDEPLSSVALAMQFNARTQ